MSNKEGGEEGGESFHHGALAHPHEGEREGVRGAKMVHKPGEEGETSLIKCTTSKGPFMAKLHRDWAPNGYDRATALFQKGFYDNSHFFRVVKGFIVQFGISYTTERPLLQFANTPIPDDPHPENGKKFAKGIMAFAGSGPDSRTSQMFISYGDNPGLGNEKWEVPFGEVIEGMETLENLYSYGDMPPWGKGPEQQKIRSDPNYIKDNFPLLDKFEKCTVEIHKPSVNADAAGGDADAAGGDADLANAVPDPIVPDAEEALLLEEKKAKGEQLELRKVADFKDAKEDDSVGEKERRAAEKTDGAQGSFGPFEDMMQVGAVVAGVIIVLLLLASLSRRRKKKKHKH